MWQLALDGIVITLLGLTIYFCRKLNSKIVELKSSKDELLNLVKTFDEAIRKTNQNVTELKAMSKSSTQELQNYISEATKLIDDLKYLTSIGNGIADRIEVAISTVRKADYQNPQQPVNQNESPKDRYVAPASQSLQTNNQGLKAIKATFAKTRDEFLAAIKSNRR